jgi:protein-L-isoaspartate O-methyltransferase
MILINWRRKLLFYEFILLEFLAIKINIFSKLLQKWRTPIFLRDIQMAKITECDKVFFIGCGMLPSAPILIAEETNATVVTIDNNKRAYMYGKEYIKRMNLSDKILVKYGDGITYPIHDFDVIFIAINVWPLQDVLQNLSENLKSGARVICKGLKNDVTITLKSDNLSDDFSVEDVIDNPKTQSFLFIKK